MNILVFGADNETDNFVDMMDSHQDFVFRKKIYTKTSDYDDFLRKLKGKYDVVFILTNGAKGMESVIATKDLCPKTPIIWFSNDKDFGAQSYRLGTEYFAAKPITDEHLVLVAKKLRLC